MADPSQDNAASPTTEQPEAGSAVPPTRTSGTNFARPASLDGRPYRPAPEQVILIIRLLAIAAALVSCWLLYQSLTAGPAGCVAGADCSAVITSSYGKWLGLPVSVLAIGMYLGVLLASTRVGPRPPARERRLAWQIMTLFAVAILGAAGWFIYLQAVVLEAWCIYCMTAHSIGALLAVLVIVRGPLLWSGEPDDPRLGLRGAAAAWPVVVGLLAVALLVGGQILSPSQGNDVQVIRTQSAAFDDDGHVITLDKHRIKVDPANFPIHGSTDAERLVLVIFDYTCPFCRAMHSQLNQVLERYDRQVAFVMLPMPLDAACNDLIAHTDDRHKGSCAYAQLSLAVFDAAPDQWQAFDKWLATSTEEPPSLEAARAKAIEIVGQASLLDEALASEENQQKLQRNIRLYKVAGAGSLPTMISDNMLVMGKPPTDDALFKILEAELGITPSRHD